MSTAIIGVGNIGKAVASHLVAGGEPVVLAATEPPLTLATELGDLASAATVSDAIKSADVIVFAVWFDVMKGLIEQHRPPLAGKVIVDPSNPIAMNDKGDFSRTLPEGESAARAGLRDHEARAAGFDPVKAGGLGAAIRIEMFGDLHDYGGLQGRLLDVAEARAAVAGA